MRVLGVDYRGIIWNHPVATRIDYAGLGPGLVAIVGPNGSGKTTALEIVPGALFGKFPSRKKGKHLINFAADRDTWIRARFAEGDSIIEALVQIDSHTRKTEATITVDGEPITEGVKVLDYAAEVARLFGSETLLLSSVFAAQSKRGAILYLPRAERKVLFAELLGLGHYRQLLELATKHRTIAEKEVQRRRDRRTGDITAIKELPWVEESLKRLDAGLAERAVSIEGLRGHLAETEELKKAGDELQAQQAHTKVALITAQEALKVAREEMERCEGLGPSAEEIAASRHQELQEQADQLKEARTSDTELLGQEGAIKAAVAGMEEISTGIAGLEGILAEHEAAKTAFTQRTQEAKTAQDRSVRINKRREVKLKQLKMLGGASAPCKADAGWIAGGGGSGTPVDLAGDCDFLELSRGAQAQIEGGIPEDKELADSIEAVEAAAFRLDEAEGARDKLDEKAERAAESLKELRSRLTATKETADKLALLEAAQKRAATWVGMEAAAVRQAKAVEEVLELALAGAEEVLELARPALDEAEKIEADLQVQVDEMIAILDVGPQVQDLEGRIKAQEKALAAGQTKAAEVRGRRDLLLEAKARLDAGAQELAEMEADLSDWVTLEEALGPNGVPNLLLDAAGPEVAELANELLQVCYGGRFSIRFDTLMELVKKRGQYKEDFSIKVFDGGEMRDIEDLSGGEQVIVEEALGIALAIFNAKRSGIRWETLFRDETAGALDEEGARPAYVNMLRRALEIGGFFQVIFVAHDAEVWQAADAQLFFKDGQLCAA